MGRIQVQWIKSRRLTYGVDVEPKVLLLKRDADPGWVTLDPTPSIEYSHGEWLDVLGELLIARTKQPDHLNSTEITPRIGLRLHLLSNLREDLVKEKRWQLDDVTERYANKQRVRGGLGYRHSSDWGFEGLLIWDRSRNTIDQPFNTSDVVVDLTVKRVW